VRVLRPVRVYWEDTCGIQGWRHGEEAVKFTPAHCESIGWLVTQDSKRVLLALSYNHEQGTVADCLIIPRGCVSKVVQLEVKK